MDKVELEGVSEGETSPRDRVVTSLREESKILFELNVLNDRWAKGWGRNTLKEHHALQQVLGDRLETWERSFMTEVVNQEPEAQAWVDIERESLEATIRDYHSQLLHPTTPTDTSYANVQIRCAKEMYERAVGNLGTVRERTMDLSS